MSGGGVGRGRPLRAAIVGCGRMGGTIDDEVECYTPIVLPYSHAATYAAAEGVELVAIADLDGERLERFGARWEIPEARRYVDYREMIRTEKPDIVSVTTPATRHAEIVVFAAENGVRGIWCEKAMACSMAECDVMVEAVEKHGVKFNLGTVRRWHPAVIRLREMIEAGELGTVRSIVTFGGAMLLHGGSHYWDLMLRLAGDGPVEWVQGNVETTGVVGVSEESDWWDGAGNRALRDLPGSGQCRFVDGTMAYYASGGLAADVEVIGTEMAVRSRNNGVEWEVWRRGERPGWQHRKRTLAPFNREEFPAFEVGSPSLALLEDLRDAVWEDRETLGGARVARAGTELCLGMVASDRRGGARVGVPLEDRTLYVVSK